MIDPVFVVCAGVSLASAFMVATRKNPVYSALWLMQCFLAFAVVFFSLGATFVGAMHILVYTGAILVLFLFVIMLLNLKPAELPPEAPTIQKFTLLGCTALIALALAWGGVQQWKLERAEGWEGAILKPEELKEAPAVALTDEKGAALKDDAGEPIKAEWGSTAHVGRELFFTHALPFEILSVLIIVAVFGGVVLAKRTL